MLTPKNVASADTITGLRLSLDGSKVVYTVGPITRSGDHRISSLWMAYTSVTDSAKQITFGEFKDHSPVFHPSGDKLYFLSDREKAGAIDHIYQLSVPSQGSEPEIPESITEEIKAGVMSFGISPDGKYIAFTSADESKPDNEAKDKVTVAEPEIYGKSTGLARLRLLDLRNLGKGARTLVSVEEHVSSFTWSPDSSRIAYRLTHLPDIESSFLPVKEEYIDIEEGSGTSISILTHPRMPDGRTVWTKRGDLFFVRSVSPDNIASSGALWKSSPSPNSTATLIGYGETDDVNAATFVNSDSYIALEVATGLTVNIDIVDGSGRKFTLFKSNNDAIMYLKWDVQQIYDGSFVFAAVRSSGVTSEPENIWSGSSENGKTGLLSCKLSSHNEWFDPKSGPITKAFSWTGSDGQALQGILTYPRGEEPVKLPTVVVPHGGPYARDALDFYFSIDRWRHLLAAHGYLVLSPNYRGSRGRGDKFAKAADGGMGTLDYDDVETMVDAAIAEGLADPDKLGIAGYSQGGFLAAWAVTRPNSRFKAAVMGAAPTDWGTLSMTTDMPDLEARLGGNAPWSSGEPLWLSGSPIRYVKNVKIPVLILHGKEDKRVPVSQAIGFMRGLLRETNMGHKSELIMYPREGHEFQERLHGEDMCRRVLEYLDNILR